MDRTTKIHFETIDMMSSGGLPEADRLARLIAGADAAVRDYAARLAREITLARFGDGVFIRGLVEVSSFCRNDCLYCGIRRSNARAERYRLDDDEIFARCREGRGLGFRTFVLQGGEDPCFTDDRLAGIVARLRNAFPECAVALSMGERSRESYARLFAAGANRYLLRHETADAEHYGRLHPAELRLENRLRCLEDLREIGFQTGSGFMVGSPCQTAENLAADLLFLKKFGPAMVGIGPFIPHGNTPFAGEAAGNVEATLLLLSLTRLFLPAALLPATTALASLTGDGRERGILAGANVVMPNLSPVEVRAKYNLYDGKLASDAEAAENLRDLEGRLRHIGRRIDWGRGDYGSASRRGRA